MDKKNKHILWGIIFCLVCYIIILSIFKPKPVDEELILVHILFRHGQRTPDLSSHYPNDPHKNNSHYPYGRGELTMEGKRELYQLGQEIRSRYNKFLGDTYIPNIIKARTSNFNRSKMSLELFLASLFPPIGSQRVFPGINWQPIPFYINDKFTDLMFMPFYNLTYMGHLVSAMNEKKDKYRDLYEYASNHTGYPINNLLLIVELHFILRVQEELGLELPKWVHKIYPESLYLAQMDFYNILVSNNNLVRVLPGVLLKNIIDTTTSKIERKVATKINIYSGHEANMASLMVALGIFKNEVPPHGSYILMEIVKRLEKYAIKIFYQDHIVGKPQILKLPNCELVCPINKFIKIIEDFLPEKDIEEN